MQQTANRLLITGDHGTSMWPTFQNQCVRCHQRDNMLITLPRSLGKSINTPRPAGYSCPDCGAVYCSNGFEIIDTPETTADR